MPEAGVHIHELPVADIRPATTLYRVPEIDEATVATCAGNGAVGCAPSSGCENCGVPIHIT